ncbi:hypothetical protein FA15DRAFT_649771 [Coprinopsis marcescibilis]|uniref:DUF7918 domain-containing protein n=1 Tax=Coprinopsis marcescibilis TaxID=230819 RepID=A0A5C3KDM8_COPMA|nr:hypothetical protein FA15DRAFT_649771 [Coprinopsis marcescibilis]
MPQLLGFHISVEMGGKVLPEYDINVDHIENETPVISCWIPSSVGKTFRILVAVPPPPRTVHHSFNLSLDGSLPSVKGCFIKKNSQAPFLTLAEEVVSPTQSRDFQFSPIQTTGVDDGEPIDTYNEKVGEIGVHVSSVLHYVKSSNIVCTNSVTGGQILERSKKVLKHCVDYGEAREVKTQITSWRPVGKELLATFLFRYRSLDYLVAQGIAPKTAFTATAARILASRSKGGRPSCMTSVPLRLPMNSHLIGDSDRVTDERQQRIKKPTLTVAIPEKRKAESEASLSENDFEQSSDGYSTSSYQDSKSNDLVDVSSPFLL